MLLAGSDCCLVLAFDSYLLNILAFSMAAEIERDLISQRTNEAFVVMNSNKYEERYMFRVLKYPHGAFCWVELRSPGHEQIKDFYANLMDWEVDDAPQNVKQKYTAFQKDGQNVAGFCPMDEQATNIYDQPQWVNYISVNNTKLLADRVSEYGGTILLGPTEAFDGGSMMIIQDPTGASVVVWQPKRFIGAGLINTPGTFTWNELITPYPEKALEFYSKLLGWTYHPQEGQEDYYLIQNNGRNNAGVLHMNEAWGNAPARWYVYFSIDNHSERLAKAKLLGGTEIEKPTDGGETNQYSLLVDPVGAKFHITQLTNIDEWTES